MVAPILKGPMLKKEMSGDLHPLISLEINRLWRVLELGAGPVKNLLDCWGWRQLAYPAERKMLPNHLGHAQPSHSC